MTQAACGRRERGFALLIVLWAIVLLALIAARLSGTGRIETQIAANERVNAVAEAAADGGVREAAFRLLAAGAGRWQAQRLVFETTIGTAVVSVVAEPVFGRVNPNTAPIALLAALFRQLGDEPAQAAALARAIVLWRSPAGPSALGAAASAYHAAGRAVLPPGRPFTTLDELADVLGMTPELLEALKPHVSLFNHAEIDRTLASPQVRRALEESRQQQPAVDDLGLVIAVTARVALPQGGRFARSAAMRLRPGQEGPYQVLAWEGGVP